MDLVDHFVERQFNQIPDSVFPSLQLSVVLSTRNHPAIRGANQLLLGFPSLLPEDSAPLAITTHSLPSICFPLFKLLFLLSCFPFSLSQVYIAFVRVYSPTIIFKESLLYFFQVKLVLSLRRIPGGYPLFVYIFAKHIMN